MIKEKLNLLAVYMLAYGSLSTWVKRYQYVCAYLALSSTTLLTLLTFSMKLKGGKIFSHFYLTLIQ